MALCSTDSSNSTIGDHLRWRNPRNSTPRNSTTDPNPQQISSIMQSTGCKSTISSLLLSTFSSNNHENPHKNNNNNNNNNNKLSCSKKYIKGSSLLGFGCTAQPEVSVPEVIRSSADWEEKRENDKNKKKKMKNVSEKKKKQQHLQGVMMMEDSVVQDLWCGADSAAAVSVDCVRPLPSRNKIDFEKLQHHNREHGSCSSRQRVNTEHFGGMELDSAFDRPDVFEARYYHHFRNQSPEGLAEILMFQNGLLMSRSSGGLDRYRDLRLDVDSMTYEELLELGERIGHVNTGLGEEQIGRCLRKTKVSVVEVEPKCSICQEEYEADDEMGKLECGHAYHLHCIKQWLAWKNTCPVCKAAASSQ